MGLLTSQENWDNYFIDIADVIRQKSKDPSSKIGAVVTQANSIVATGFNGFPRGIDETQDYRWERPIKYEYVSHAEANALINAARTGVATLGGTLYLVGFGPPTVPCVACSKLVIQAGIIRVVGRAYKPVSKDWIDDLYFAQDMLFEAGVIFTEMPLRETV